MNRVIELGRVVHRMQGIRFLAVGLFNTLVGYVIYLVGLSLGARPEVALAFATSCGAIFNYFTTAHFVFGHRALNRLPLFVFTYGIIYTANVLAIRLLLRAGFPPNLAQACLLPVMATLSFLMFRTLVFRQVGPR